MMYDYWEKQAAETGCGTLSWVSTGMGVQQTGDTYHLAYLLCL